MSFSWLQRLLKRTSKTYVRPAKVAKRRTAFALTVENLEDRVVPAFLAPVNFPAGTSPTAIATGDFNGDGRQDIVTVNNVSFSVSVLQGNGDGTFQAPVSSPTGAYPLQAGSGRF